MLKVEVRGEWAHISWEDDIPQEDVAMALVEEAYATSDAIGMGRMHFREGPLPDEDREAIREQFQKTGSVNLDYVRGRCCKFCLETPTDPGAKEVRVADAHWTRDHPQMPVGKLAERAAERLTSEDPYVEPQSIEAVIEQAVVPVKDGEVEKSKSESGFMTVTLPDWLTPDEADNAEDVSDGDLKHVDGAVVNVAALRGREAEVAKLARQGHPAAVAAHRALQAE